MQRAHYNVWVCLGRSTKELRKELFDLCFPCCPDHTWENGRERFRFFVDTGQRIIWVDSDLCKRVEVLTYVRRDEEIDKDGNVVLALNAVAGLAPRDERFPGTGE